MPELPEVETIRRDLERSIQGLTIQKIFIRDPRVIRQKTGDFLRAVRGRTVVSVGRRGKALLFDLEGMWLVVQPMMTGQLVAVPPGGKPAILKECKVIFQLSKHWRLLYNDQRLFGRLEAVPSLEQHPYVSRTGLEPLSGNFSVRKFRTCLRGRRVAVKRLLLDHKVVTGIGNIYASEILFRAGISPFRKAGRLTSVEAGRVHGAIRGVLEEAVRMRGTSMRNYRDGEGREGAYQKIIRVYGREGQPCLVCGTAIRKKVQGQRSTFYCPRCQKAV